MAAPHFQSLPFPFPAALCVADWCHFGCQGGAAYARHQTPWKMCGQARGKSVGNPWKGPTVATLHLHE